MVHTPLRGIQACRSSCETKYQEKPPYASEPSAEGEETGTEILEIFNPLKNSVCVIARSFGSVAISDITNKIENLDPWQ
jgi:hypothetical protein